MGTRFPITHEVEHIHDSMRDELQRKVGTSVQWYAYNPDGTSVHDVYDVGEYRDWFDPITLPVISAIRQEGVRQPSAEGFYTTDSVHLIVSYAAWRSSGLEDPQRVDDHLKSRIVYDDVVFTVMGIQIRGQLGERDIVIGIDCAEVDPAELVNDPDFQHWAEG